MSTAPESRLQWRKSSRSASAGECVEVAVTDGFVAVRDSKDPAGPKLRFGNGAWREFIRAVHEGQFDR